MFYGATKFNQPLNTWDVAKVTTTNHMFENAYKFNQPLDNWRLDKVKEIKYMFQYANKFKQDLGWCLDEDVDFGHGYTIQDAFYYTPCASTSCGVVQNAAGTCAPTPAPIATPGSDTVDAAHRLSGVSAALLVLALRVIRWSACSARKTPLEVGRNQSGN